MPADRIRELNDAFRTGQRPELGQIVITPGVRELVAAWPLGIVSVYEAVKSFDAFDTDNDPHHEHDFGAFEHAGATLFFKIDYCDEKLKHGSDDPANPHITKRVLTIMRADEY
ncbi:MAG: DUF3768 domain-containing protein [Prosthecobacter sp.]|nr:DUF3768 domain-containing protein [Prosthecobacter sp.]